MNRAQPLPVLALALLTAPFCSSKSQTSKQNSASDQQADVSRLDSQSVPDSKSMKGGDGKPNSTKRLVGQDERIEAKSIYEELSSLYGWPYEDQYESWRTAGRIDYCRKQLKKITPRLIEVQRRALRLSDRYRELKGAASRISMCIHCDPNIPISECHFGGKVLSYALHEVQ